MTSRLEALAARRRALVRQSDALREHLVDSSHGIRQVLGFADMGVAAGRVVARWPGLLIGVAAGLLVLRSQRAGRVLGLALTALSTYGRLRRILSALR